MTWHVPRHVATRAVLILVVAGSLPATSCADDNVFGSTEIVGLGGAYAGAANEAATIWLNPALAALSPAFMRASLATRNLYQLEALQERTGSIAVRMGRRAVVGAGFSQFGQSGLYTESRGVVAASAAFWRSWALGVGVQYDHVEFGDNTKAYSGSSFALGMASRPLREIVMCAVIRGITIDRLYVSNNVPAVVELSAAWEAPDITLAGIWSKPSGERSRFGLGQSLQVAKGLPLGAGVIFLSGLRFAPIRYSLGARILVHGASFDYAYQNHPDLGGTHVLGVTFQLGAR